ncbi:MAG: inositol monophosphatase [Isosphaeraceae bacterium]
MDVLGIDLEFVLGVAREAAALAMRRSLSVTPEEKANKSYVTDLDRDMECFIRDRLAARFPDDQLTGEEFADSGGKGRRRWSIDPIDGTGNLVHQLPLWCISIGLIDDGEPVLGVIAAPPLNELYWATKGGGAWRDGQRLIARDADTLHDQDNVCLGTNAFRVVDPRSLPGRLRDLGSACIELAFVSAGRLQCTASLGEQAHDIAAGVVIASEAGCTFATLDGRYLAPREFVGEAPVGKVTFTSTPRRMKAILSHARRLPPREATS